MTYGTSGSDQRRLRVVAVFLVAGVALVLWVWGNWLDRATAAHQEAVPLAVEAPESDQGDDKVVQALPLLLLAGLLLVLVFLVASYVIVRGGRRYRTAMSRKRASPTATDDVWATHKLPPDPGQPDHDQRSQ